MTDKEIKDITNELFGMFEQYKAMTVEQRKAYWQHMDKSVEEFSKMTKEQIIELEKTIHKQEVDNE